MAELRTHLATERVRVVSLRLKQTRPSSIPTLSITAHFSSDSVWDLETGFEESAPFGVLSRLTCFRQTSSKPTSGESEGRTATKAFRKRDLPTDQAQAQQPEWDVPQWDVQVSAIRQLL